MAKNKKVVTVLSTAAITGLITAAVGSTAFAKTSGILVKNGSNDYKYDLSTLQKAFDDNQMDSTQGVLYQDYANKLASGKVIGLYDDTQAGKVIDYSKVQAAFEEAQLDGTNFILNAYTEKSADYVTPTDPIYDQSVGTDGKIVSELEKDLTKITVNSVNTINATTVVATLADGADATVAADKTQYTVKVGDKPVTVSSVSYDATSQKATLTVDLSNLAGTITVNGIASSKDVDYVAPTISEVKAQAATVIDIKFSEKVDATEAENVANYKLRYALGKASDTTFAATLGDGNVEATAKLLPDGQTVRMTIVSVGKDVVFPGLQNGGLVKDAPYQMQVINSKITDLAGNKAASGYGVMFYGTNIADSQAAKVLSAKYDSSTGKLNVSFDKAIKAATLSNIKLVADGKDAVDLSAAASTINGNNVEINASALVTKIAALGNTFSVQYADGAFVDANENNVVAATTAVTVTQGLNVTGASYDANKNILTLNFNDVVDITKIPDDLSGITIAGKSIGTSTSVKLINTTNAKDIQLQLADETKPGEGTADLEAAILANKDKEDGVVVSFDATKVTFTAVGSKDPMVVVGNTVTIKNATYVADTVAPTLNSVSLKGIVADNGTITLKFSEKVDPASVTGAGIAFYDAKDLTNPITTLDKVVANEKTAGTFVDTLTFKLDTDTDTKAVAKLINDALTAKKSLVVSVKAKAVTDLNGTQIAELTPANGVAATVFAATADATADKFVATAKGSKVVELKVTASGEPVALDKSIAENVANYTVVPTNGGAAIKVNSAVYSADGTVMLYLSDATSAVKEYTLTATGLKTQGGVAVQDQTAKDGKFAAKFMGIIAQITDAPVTPVTADVNGNGKFDAGDTITLDFGTPIYLADGAKASDIKVNASDDAKVPAGTLGSSTLKVDGSKLVITLSSDAKVAVNNKLVLAEVDSKILNSDGQAAFFATAAAVLAPDTTAPTIATATFNDANANGILDKDDTITITFSGKVTAADAADLTDDFVFAGGTNNKEKLSKVELSQDGMSATLTLDDVSDLTPGKTTINFATGLTNPAAGADKDLAGLWGKSAAAAEKPVIVAKSDKVQPTVQSAKYVVKDDGTKTIVLQMSEKVGVATAAKFSDTFAIVDGSATISVGDKVSVDPDDATKVIITLTDEADFVAPGTSTIKVAPVATANITDANGNKVLFTGSNIVIGQ